jgi:purine-binding chemotaxis protein CheW
MPTIAEYARDSAVSQGKDARQGKYLMLQLDTEEYGIRVLQVREIIGVQDITPVPHTPPHVKGVINLRGKVIPVVDLRLKFGMHPVEATSRACIIVVQVRGSVSTTLIGLLVDGVCEVTNLASQDIEDPPEFAGSLPAPFLLGMAKGKGKVRILLDIDEVLGTGDLASLQTMVRSVA